MTQAPSEDYDAIPGLVVGPHRNIEETIEEAGQADNLFMSTYKTLNQWSVSQKKLTNEYGYIMHGNICSMVQTNDKNYLFVSDSSGC
jgi:WD40 repeat protein